MRPIDTKGADIAFDFRQGSCRVVSADAAEGVLLEFKETTPKGPIVARIALSLGQLMVLKTQVAKDFNFGF